MVYGPFRVAHHNIHGGIILRHHSYKKEHNHSDQELGEGSKEGTGFNTNIVWNMGLFSFIFLCFSYYIYVLTDFLLTSHWTWRIDLAQHLHFILSP
jgi:hypothetical protein